MARQPNDGRGRLGGRAQGTPNKPKQPVANWARGLFIKNHDSFEGLLNSSLKGKAMKVENDSLLLSALVIASALADLKDAFITFYCPEAVEPKRAQPENAEDSFCVEERPLY